MPPLLLLGVMEAWLDPVLRGATPVAAPADEGHVADLLPAGEAAPEDNVGEADAVEARGNVAVVRVVHVAGEEAAAE